jgi:hypothetical protein
VVGFYSVSIPFFDVGHPLLAGCGKEERFRVSFNCTLFLYSECLDRNMVLHMYTSVTEV